MRKIKREQIDVISNKNLNEIILLHENMFYNCLIKGFLPYSSFENLKFNFTATLNFLKDLDLYKMLFKNFDQLPSNDLIKKWGYKQKNNKIHFGATRSIIEKDLILNSHKLIKNKQKYNIIELGSGYGAVAERLFENNKINSLILVDLPSSLSTAFYYLSTKFGLDKVKILSTPSDVQKYYNLEEKKILLIPTCYYDLIKNFKNIDSLCGFSTFSEMDFKTIKFYLENLPREIKLLVISNSNDEEAFSYDYQDIMSDELPIPKNFDLIFSSIRMPFFANWKYKTCVWFKNNQI